MSGQADGAKRSGKLDRWNLPPAKRGILRGVVINVRSSTVEAPFGQLQIIDFDLAVDEKLPLVPVQMRGNDFTRPLLPNCLADVPDPDASVRPIRPRIVTFPHSPGYDLISYYPGQDDPKNAKDSFWALVAIVGPVVSAAGLAAWIGWYFGLF